MMPFYTALLVMGAVAVVTFIMFQRKFKRTKKEIS